MTRRIMGSAALAALLIALAGLLTAQAQMADERVPPAEKSQPAGRGFVPGPTTLYALDLAAAPLGAMPRDLRTNGSAKVVTADGIPGHWLALADSSTYKLSPALHVSLPPRFTVEFDVIPLSESTPSDLGEFSFGFARDDAVRAFIRDANHGGAINNVNFNYLEGRLVVASSASGYHKTTDIGWGRYAYHPVHVAIAVDGDRMQVYLDRRKMLDARMFRGAAGHFYFSASPHTQPGAQLLFGNLRIGGFGPAPSSGTAPRRG